MTQKAGARAWHQSMFCKKPTGSCVRSIYKKFHYIHAVSHPVSISTTLVRKVSEIVRLAPFASIFLYP